MARWVQLTTNDDQKLPLLVNLENATYLRSREPGTRIYFGTNDYADVVEEADAILKTKPIDL
jgi:hypothetical protein